MWQIYIRGQRAGILHEEASEEEGQGCCLRYCLSSYSLYQNFMKLLTIHQQIISFARNSIFFGREGFMGVNMTENFYLFTYSESCLNWLFPPLQFSSALTFFPYISLEQTEYLELFTFALYKFLKWVVLLISELPLHGFWFSCWVK